MSTGNARGCHVGEWTTIDTQINRVVAESDASFHPDTIANAKDFIAFVRGRCDPPNVGKGYWPTLSFSWDVPPFEVEIFGDRLELYRFYDGRMDVEHVVHTPGEPFPPTFLAKLPMIAAR